MHTATLTNNGQIPVFIWTGPAPRRQVAEESAFRAAKAAWRMNQGADPKCSDLLLFECEKASEPNRRVRWECQPSMMPSRPMAQVIERATIADLVAGIVIGDPSTRGEGLLDLIGGRLSPTAFFQAKMYCGGDSGVHAGLADETMEALAAIGCAYASQEPEPLRNISWSRATGVSKIQSATLKAARAATIAEQGKAMAKAAIAMLEACGAGETARAYQERHGL